LSGIKKSGPELKLRAFPLTINLIKKTKTILEEDPVENNRILG